MATYDQIRAELTERLPKASKKKLDELADWIYDLDPSEDGSGLTSVEVQGARCVVGRIEAHGLEIDVDAVGNASAVHFPYGAYAA